MSTRWADRLTARDRSAVLAGVVLPPDWWDGPEYPVEGAVVRRFQGVPTPRFEERVLFGVLTAVRARDPRVSPLRVAMAPPILGTWLLFGELRNLRAWAACQLLAAGATAEEAAPLLCRYNPPNDPAPIKPATALAMARNWDGKQALILANVSPPLRIGGDGWSGWLPGPRGVREGRE